VSCHDILPITLIVPGYILSPVLIIASFGIAGVFISGCAAGVSSLIGATEPRRCAGSSSVGFQSI
jgi:hypothetical protein